MDTPYAIGDWIVDPNRGIVSRDGRDARLEPKAIELLTYFAARPGDVISRAELLDALWPGVTVGDEVITNTIAKIRRTFGDDPKSPSFIETVPKRGYRLVAAVKTTGPATTENSPPQDRPANTVRPRIDNRVWIFLATVAAALAITVMFDTGRGNKDPAPATPSVRTAPAQASIAVLPFVNMSGDEEQEYFSDGLTEDLITDLSRISALTVISRSSTFAYKGKSPDVRAVAKDLGVRYVVEGSVRKVGQKVRITAQLIEAATGNHLWAHRYDRDFGDIFDLQDEVRNEIVASLEITLSPAEEQRLSRHISNNPEAYDFYLKGLKQESYFTRENNFSAQKLFLEAIARDPEFAAAYAHLAQTYSLTVENGWSDRPEDFQKKALETALRGTRLDAELPYAYWSLGRIYTRSYIGDLDSAQAAFKKAVSLNPNFADGYMFLAYTHIYTGKAEQALGLIEKAMRINPHFPFWYLQALGMAQFFMGNPEAAVQTLQKAVERNPNVPWLRRHLIAAYGGLGLADEARWEISELESLGQQATVKSFMDAVSVRDPVYRKAYEDALRRAGVPEG